MMCEEMIFEYWFSTIRKLSARKKYLLRELIGSGKKIYYIEETEIIGIEFLTEGEKEGLKKARKEKTKEQLKEEFCKMQEHGIEFIPFFSKEHVREHQREQQLSEQGVVVDMENIIQENLRKYWRQQVLISSVAWRKESMEQDKEQR